VNLEVRGAERSGARWSAVAQDVLPAMTGARASGSTLERSSCRTSLVFSNDATIAPWNVCSESFCDDTSREPRFLRKDAVHEAAHRRSLRGCCLRPEGHETAMPGRPGGSETASWSAHRAYPRAIEAAWSALRHPSTPVAVIQRL
jgi:hypothetical protein